MLSGRIGFGRSALTESDRADGDAGRAADLVGNEAMRWHRVGAGGVFGRHVEAEFCPAASEALAPLGAALRAQGLQNGFLSRLLVGVGALQTGFLRPLGSLAGILACALASRCGLLQMAKLGKFIIFALLTIKK